MCMGIEIRGMGFPWEFYGNGNSFLATKGNGDGNNVMRMGTMRIAKKVPFCITKCSDR